ncbi:hypothetical protein [Massilia sp. PWRC2]|uniref:hypothetical protein n=1 Tax=Massilia sp. PWRC2 TaxID=2804626 RepID=UPI003CED1786
MKKNLAIPGTLFQMGLFTVLCISCVIALMRKFPALHDINLAQSGSILSLFCTACAVIHHIWWDLADSVTDFGSNFVIRRRGKVISIKLEEIAWVGFSVQRPPLVTFHFYHANIFGKEISFIPVGETWQIAIEKKSSIAELTNHRLVEAKKLT